MNEDVFIKFKKRIENYFLSKKFQEVKLADIILHLHIRNKDVSFLKEALDELLKEKKIESKNRNRFSLSKSVKTVESDEKKGIIQIVKSGAGFIKVEGSEHEVFVKRRDVANSLNGDEVTFKVIGQGNKGEEAEITGVLKRNKIKFVGKLERQMNYGFVIPNDPKIHVDFFITHDHLGEAQDGQIVQVELLDWNDPKKRPEAKIIEIIGNPGDVGVDIQAVFKEYNINETFELDVVEEAKRFKINSKKELESRLDLRHDTIFTIDPVDAKDFDDAVSLETNEQGNYVLGVHIADVSHFVVENSLLDKEAVKRGCSVYLVDRVIPMLPEELSNDLCSLKPNEDRLCYSAIMEFEPNSLKRVGYQIKKTIIHSKKRFTYEEVQDVLDLKTEHSLKPKLLEMNTLAKRFRKERFEAGSIDFHTPEVRFTLDELGKPTGLVRKKQLDSMKLIEEFMLLANKCVAEHIRIKSKKDQIEYASVYRVHDRPSDEKLEFLRNFLKGMGIEIKFPKKITPKQFQEIVGALLAGPDADIINDVAVRSMMKAVYTINNIGHFGLGFSDYSHFTSPIRRYPDLILHRLLFDYNEIKDDKRLKHYKKILPGICEQSSQNEKNAEKAERESIKLKQVEFMMNFLGDEFAGKISGVTDFGIFVEIEEYLIEGMIRLQSMKDDYYSFTQETLSVTGRKNGLSYRLGQKVKVKVIDVNRAAKTIDFEIVDSATAPKKIKKKS